MDFNAKRLALLAGVGDQEDRHAIVQEQVQQLNESAQERQLSEDEDQVRKAVRRTIQKMISEGVISLQEDSIERELEHLRKNIAADHDHIADLLDDIRADRDEEHRAEHHRDEMHDMDEAHHEEVEESVEDRLARNLKSKGEWEKDMLSKSSDDGYHDIELDDPDLDDSGLAEDELKEALNESDAALRRLQALAGVQILTEGYSDDELRELCHSKDHNCAVVVDHPDWGRGKPIYESHALPDDEGNVEWYDVQFKHGIERKVMAEDMTILQMEGHGSKMKEREDDGAPAFPGPGQIPAMDATADRKTGRDQVQEDEAKLYELEDGRMYMEMGGKRYMMQEMEEEMDEAELKGTMDTEKKEFTPEPIPVE